MNREIKFRGLREDGKWVYGFPYIHNGYSGTKALIRNEKILDTEVKLETLTEFTGLKDKNGVEIYEGDIYHQGDPNITYTVVWQDTGLKGKQNKSTSYAGLEAWKDKIEVIGNIYENPELVGDKYCLKSIYQMMI